MTDAQYETKFKEMQKYIPFLQKVIEKLKVNNAHQDDNPRKAQLQKMEMLHELLTNKAKRLKMETLMKCEGVLIKLHAKIEKQSTLLQNEDSILNNIKMKANNDASTSTTAKCQSNNEEVVDISGPASPPPEVIILDDIDQPIVIPTERRCSPVMVKEKPTTSHKPQQHRSRHDQFHQQHNKPGQQLSSDKIKIEENLQNLKEKCGGSEVKTNSLKDKHGHHHSHHHDSPKDNRNFKEHHHHHSTPKDLNSPRQNSPLDRGGQHTTKDPHIFTQSPITTKSASTSSAQVLQTVKVVITEPLPAHIKQQHFASYRQYPTQSFKPRESICHSNLKTLPQLSNQNSKVEPAREVHEVYSPEELWEEYNESHNKRNTNKSSNTVFSRLGDKVPETPSTCAPKATPISIPGRYTPIPDVLKSPPLSAHDINNLLLESGGDKLSNDISEIGSRRPQKPMNDTHDKRHESPINSLDFLRKKLTQIAKLNSPQPETPASPTMELEKPKGKDANKMNSPLPNERVALKYNPHPRQERLQSISSNEGSECSTQSRNNDPRLKAKLHSTNPLQNPVAHITSPNVNVLPSINYSDPRLKRQNPTAMLTSPITRTNFLSTPTSSHTPVATSLTYAARKDPRISRVQTNQPNTTLPPVRRLSTTQPHYSSEENWDSEPEETTRTKSKVDEVSPVKDKIDPRLSNSFDRSNRSASRGPPPNRRQSISQPRPMNKESDLQKQHTRQAPSKRRQSISEARAIREMEPPLAKAKPPKSDSEENWDSEPETEEKSSKETKTQDEAQSKPQLQIPQIAVLTTRSSPQVEKEGPKNSEIPKNIVKTTTPIQQKPKRNSDREEDWDSEPEVINTKPAAAITKDIPTPKGPNDRSPLPQLLISPQSQAHNLPNTFGNPLQNQTHISPNNFGNPMQNQTHILPNTFGKPMHHIAPSPVPQVHHMLPNHFNKSPYHMASNFYVPPPGIQTSEAHNRFSAILNDKSERIKYFESKKQKSAEPRTYKEFREAKLRAQAQEEAIKRAAREAEAKKISEEMKLNKEKDAVKTECNKKATESLIVKKPTQQKPQVSTVKSSTLIKDAQKSPAAGESTLDKMYRTQNFSSNFPKAYTSFKIPKKKTEDKPQEETNKTKLETKKPNENNTKETKKTNEETKKKCSEETNKTNETANNTNEATNKSKEKDNFAISSKQTDVSQTQKTITPDKSEKILDEKTSTQENVNKKSAGQKKAQTKQDEKEINTNLTQKDDNQKEKLVEKETQEEKSKTLEQKSQDTKNSIDYNKNNRDPRCRTKNQTDNKEKETETDNDIVVTSSETELTLKPDKESLDEKYKAALDKFNKVTQELASKPQRISRRRDTMIQFGSAPLVDKEKLMKANALLFEDVQEQEKRLHKKAEEERQNARRNKHLEEMFQKTDDNCTVSTQNIIVGKRRTRTLINFNETVIGLNVFKHLSKRDSTGGNTNTTPTSTAKTTRASAKTKNKAEEDKAKHTDTEEETEEDNYSEKDKSDKEKPPKEARTVNRLKQNFKDKESVDEADIEPKSESQPSTSKGKPGKKNTEANKLIIKDTKTQKDNLTTKEIPTVSIPRTNIKNISEDEHQNCAVSSTSVEIPIEKKAATICSSSSSATCKKDPDDNEPTSTANKSNTSNPTPDVLNDIVQQIIKPNADRQHILGLLEQILSKDHLEIFKTIIEKNTSKQNEEQQKQAKKKQIPKTKSEQQEEEEEEQNEDDEQEDEDHLASSSKSEKIQNKKSTPVAKKKRNELDRLNEDIRDMFICEGVLTATGRRMCTLIGQSNAKGNESNNKKSTNPVKEPETLSKRRGPKTLLEKRKIAATTPLRRSLRSCKQNEEDEEDEIESNGTTESNDDLDSTDSSSTDTPPRRKMPVLKPNTPIKLPEEENHPKEIANKRKSDNKPCPKSKKSKNFAVINDDSKDNSETEGEMETVSPLQLEKLNQEDECKEDGNAKKIRNTNTHWHNQSKYTNWCMLCEKKIPPSTSAFHYKMHHGENYISRLAPVLLQKFKQGKLSQPLFGVNKKNKQSYWFYRCPFCLQYFNTPLPLWLEHFQNHTAEFRYECSRCYRGSNRQATTRRHISSQCKGATIIQSAVKLTVPTLIKAHVCHLCNFIQLKRTNLERHYIEQHRLEKKNVDVLGYTITLFDVANVEKVPEDKAVERENEAWKSIQSEEQVIDIIDDEEEDVTGKHGDKEIRNERETNKDDEIGNDNKAAKQLHKNVDNDTEEKQKENVFKEKPNLKVNEKEQVSAITKTQKEIDKTSQENENEKLKSTDNQNNLTKFESKTQKVYKTKEITEKEISLTDNQKDKNVILSKKVIAIETPKEQVKTVSQQQNEKLSKQDLDKKTVVDSKTQAENNVTLAKKVIILESPIEQVETVAINDNEKEQPVTLAKKVFTLESSEEQNKNALEEKKIQNSDTQKEKTETTECKKYENKKQKNANKSSIPIIDLVIIEDDAVQDVQNELLTLAAQHAAQEVKDTNTQNLIIKAVENERQVLKAREERNDNPTTTLQSELLTMAAQHEKAAEIERQILKAQKEEEEKSKRAANSTKSLQNELLTMAAQHAAQEEGRTYEQNLISKQPEAKTKTPFTQTTSSPALEPHTTISDLISSSIDRIYNKRKSCEMSSSIDAKKSCISNTASNAFMPTREENTSSPTIQILAQSIISIEEQTQQSELPIEKPVSISMAERLSQRFKVLQNKANANTQQTPSLTITNTETPIPKKPNPFEQLFNDTVKELEKEKDKITGNQTFAHTETTKQLPKPSVIDDITVISDDEDWEDIEITESAPTTTTTATTGNTQKAKNKGIFQKFSMFKGSNTKTKKHLPPMVFLPKKKTTKEKSQTTPQQSTTSSPTPTVKSTTSCTDKSDVTTTNSNANLGFKPVVNIMDDLLPDSPCNDPIDLVPELAPLEPLQDLNDISSILDSNLSVIEINIDSDHHTSMEDALDFISEQQAQDKQKTGLGHVVTTTQPLTQTQGKSIINNITHVGYSVQTAGENPFKFYCLLQNCTFLYSSDSIGLENHFMCEHSQIKWNGYCLMCQSQCLPNGEEYSITKEIKHMLEKHASKPRLDLINEHSTSSSQGSGEERPKIKLRRMTGDCLSTATTDNATTALEDTSTNVIPTAATSNTPLTMLGALLKAKPKPPTKEMPPQPQMPLTEPLLLDNIEVESSTRTPFNNVSEDFLITSVTSAAIQPNDSPLQISSVISLNPQPTAAAATATTLEAQIPKITNVRTLAPKAGNLWSQQIEQDRQELMESAAESLEVSQILANAGRPSITREPTRVLDDSPGPVVVAETVPVAQAKTGDFLITQTVSAQYDENSSAAVGFNINIASSSANTNNQEAIPADITTPITSRQYKCMAKGCKFLSRVRVAMSDHLRFHERRNLSLKCDYFACAFCAHQATSVEDFMKHADQYHIINKGGVAATESSDSNADTANSLTRKIHDILNSNKSSSANRNTESLLKNQNLPEQDSEEVYLKKLRDTIEEIVQPTGLSDDKLYRCVVKNCRTNLTESSFLNHIMYHITSQGGNPNNYNFKCPHCQAQYHRVSGIKAHIKNHAVDRYFCYLCEQTSTNPAQLLKHFSEKHWNTINMYTKVLLQPKTSSDGSKEVLDSEYYVAYTQELSDDDVRKFGEKLILEWQRKKSGSKTHFKSSEIDLLPLPAIFQREVNCGECEYKTKVRTNMYRHLLMHKQNPGLANNSGGQSKVASVDPVNPVPCLNSTEKFFDKMTNLASSSLIPSSSTSSTLQANTNNSSKPVYKIPYSYVLDTKRFTCGCSGCTYVTLSEDMFRTHLTTIHSNHMIFRCPFCQEDICKKSLTIDRIINHIRFHGATLYRCEECNYLHYMRYVVERHINEKHSTLKVNFVTHKRSSENNLEGTTSTISFAGKKYKESFNLHQQPQTSGSASNSESSVLKTTASSSNSTKGKGKWVCELCSHKASTLAQIQTHCQQQHGQKNQYKCAHCNYGSQQLSQILYHIDEKHSGKTREACYMYHKSVNSNDEEADTRPLWQRNDPTRVRHIRGILMEDEEESEEYRKKLGLSEDADDDEEEEALDVISPDYILGYEFSCFHCDFKVQKFDDLKTHYQNVHNSSQETAKPFWYRLLRRLCCANCRQFIGNFVELQKHLLSEHNTHRYYAADITISENEDSSLRLLCGYCSFHCISPDQLYKHHCKAQHLAHDMSIESNDHLKILNLGTSQIYYKCTLCADIFPNKVSIVQHACNVHAGEESFSFRELTNTLIYRCASCFFTSTNEMDLFRHMINHYYKYSKCHFCRKYQTTFVGYMQHCYAEHKNDIRKFRELYPCADIIKYLVNMLIIFPSGLMLSKRNLSNTQYGKTEIIEEFYEEIYKISQQPPIPRLSIARLVARKSIEAQQKHVSSSSSPQAFENESELLRPLQPQAKKISKRRYTVAVSQEDNDMSMPKPKLTANDTLLQKAMAITHRRKTLTIEPEDQHNETDAPALLQPKKISKRRCTVAADYETSPYKLNLSSPYSLLIERDSSSKKRKTSSSSSIPSPLITQEPPHYPSNLDMEPFSYYGVKPKPVDLSKIYTKVAIGGIKTPLTIDKFKQLFNIDCRIELTKCDHIQMLDYADYKHIKKACPASHKIRYN